MEAHMLQRRSYQEITPDNTKVSTKHPISHVHINHRTTKKVNERGLGGEGAKC